MVPTAAAAAPKLQRAVAMPVVVTAVAVIAVAVIVVSVVAAAALLMKGR